MKRRYLVLAFVAFCLLVRWVPTNRVVIVNESGRTAHTVCIEVCDKTTAVGDLPAGGSASVWFGTPSQEDSITIRCRLQDGTVIDESCFYIVWEQYFSRCVIVIREDGTAGPRY
jgi:hypothetical protein